MRTGGCGRKAAWALGVFGDPRAVIPLRRAMLNERNKVKEMIEEAMQEIAREGDGVKGTCNEWPEVKTSSNNSTRKIP